MRNNVAVAGARWFFPNRNQVRTETHSDTRPNDPYFRNNVPSVLVIQKFVHPYDGTYSCGPSQAFNDVSSEGDTISLTLAGMNTLVTNGKFVKLYCIYCTAQNLDGGNFDEWASGKF